jgi:hypothetical protein
MAVKSCGNGESTVFQHFSVSLCCDHAVQTEDVVARLRLFRVWDGRFEELLMVRVPTHGMRLDHVCFRHSYDVGQAWDRHGEVHGR